MLRDSLALDSVETEVTVVADRTANNLSLLVYNAWEVIPYWVSRYQAFVLWLERLVDDQHWVVDIPLKYVLLMEGL